jgi:hypothetical protein
VRVADTTAFIFVEVTNKTRDVLRSCRSSVLFWMRARLQAVPWEQWLRTSRARRCALGEQLS